VELSFLTAVPSFGAIDGTTGRGQAPLRAAAAVLSYSVLIVRPLGPPVLTMLCQSPRGSPITYAVR